MVETAPTSFVKEHEQGRASVRTVPLRLRRVRAAPRRLHVRADESRRAVRAVRRGLAGAACVHSRPDASRAPPTERRRRGDPLAHAGRAAVTRRRAAAWRRRSAGWASGARALARHGAACGRTRSRSRASCSRSAPASRSAVAPDLRRERSRALLLLAAAGIQLRLLCNLLDGMLAVEEGFKSKTGDIYNDLPDRARRHLHPGRRGLRGARICRTASTLGWAAARDGGLHRLRARARRLARRDAALHRPDGQAAPDVHADGRDAARGRRNAARAAAAGDRASGSRVIIAGSIVTAFRRTARIVARGQTRDDRGGAGGARRRLICGATVQWHCDPVADGAADLLRQPLEPSGLRRHLVGAAAAAAAAGAAGGRARLLGAGRGAPLSRGPACSAPC